MHSERPREHLNRTTKTFNLSIHLHTNSVDLQIVAVHRNATLEPFVGVGKKILARRLILGKRAHCGGRQQRALHQAGAKLVEPQVSTEPADLWL